MSIRRTLPVYLVLTMAFQAGAAQPKEAAPKRGASLTTAEARRRDAVEHFLRAKLKVAEAEIEDAIKEFRKALELDPEDGNLRREYGEFLKDIPIADEALKQARKAVELDSTSAVSHRLLGQLLMSQAQDKKSLEEAASELKKANDALPADPVGSLSYAQVLMRLEKPKEAAQVLERVIEKARNSEMPMLYAEALERSGQAAQAEEVYTSLLQQDPRAQLGLLRTLEQGRKYDKALALIEAMLKRQPANLAMKTDHGSLLMRARRFAEAEKVLTDVLRADPGFRDALWNYAALLAERRETDKADEQLRKLQALDPERPEVPFRRAFNYLEARRIPEAEKILLDIRAALVAKKKEGREISQIDGQLGYAAYLRKDYDSARKWLSPILWNEDGSVNGQALNLLLQVARDREEWAEGLRLSREVTTKSEKAAKLAGVRANLAEFLLRSSAKEEKAEGEKMLDALARDERAGALAAADAWQRLDQFGRAAATARKALETYKEDPDLLFRLAASLEREKKIPESVATFEKLLTVHADHAAGLNYLGYLWADRKENLPRALDLIQKAVDLEPSNGAYLDSLGWVYFQLNKLDRAEEFLKAAASLNPDDSAIEDHLGDLYEKMGELAKARTSWKRALSLKPEDGGKKLEEKLRRTERLVHKP